MAEPQEEVPGAGAPNRTVFVIMAIIALLFAAGGALLMQPKPSTSEKPPPPPLPPGNARALVVPTEDADRTVVVAPCGTDVEETARAAREDEAVPNTIRFVFPKGGGDRAVLIPDCSPKAGVSASISGLPAAAFVLPVGTRENSLQVPPLRGESQLVVPQNSEARTVVLAPCSGIQGGEAGKPVPSKEGGQAQDAVLEPEAGQGDLVTAAQC